MNETDTDWPRFLRQKVELYPNTFYLSSDVALFIAAEIERLNQEIDHLHEVFLEHTCPK